MPTLEQFTNSLLALPLIRALQTISARLGLRFALRGGVLRNFLLSSHRLQQAEASFYDYVDPFSNIDLALDDETDWPQLAQAIASSIPFAGFHHWEATSARAMTETSRRYATIPADRLILWFEGQEKPFARVYLDGLDVNVEEVVRHPALYIDTQAFGWEQEADVFDQLLDVLRYMRYTATFLELKPEIDPIGLLMRSEVPRRIASRRSPQPAQASIERRRLEMAILDLVFTAVDWKQVSYLLDLSRQELSPVWLEGSSFLSKIFYQSALAAGSGAGVVVYKPGPRSTLRLRLFNDARPPRHGLENVNSQIPWVRLSYSGHNPADCCNYSDFQRGVASVAWRSKSSGSDYSDLQASAFAAVAAAIPSAAEYSAGVPKSELPLFSIPAYVRKGTSVVIRVDHGYLGALLNRNVSFYLGLVPSSPR